MVFNINKNATLPSLQLELTVDGREDRNYFFDCLQNADITFCMTEIKTGKKVIGNKAAVCFVKKNLYNHTKDEYLIGYNFSARETKTPGIYVGQFFINFQDGGGTLIVPIQEELHIHVLDTSFKK